MKRRTLIITVLTAVATGLLFPTSAMAQLNLLPSAQAACEVSLCDTCPTVQDYRLVPQTIYEHKPVTTRRLETETIYEERQVVRYRPVDETTTRERKYMVNKPVAETTMREERKTVLRPVWEYRTRDASYDRVNYVTETSTREERRTVMRPVVETSTREERRTVMRPVTETVLQDQTTTAYRPVTSYNQRVVDQGQYVNQVQATPGDVSHRLRWQRAKCVPDPRTGQCEPQRAGLYWTPKQGPPQYTVNKLYVPNPVMQQLTETRMVPEQVTRKVPVSVTRMQPELQVRKVPVQTTRMVAEEQVRRIPVSVKRPVMERVDNQVEERRMKWVPQEMVRKVPVTTYKIVQEEVVEQIPVTTRKMVAEYHAIQVPRQQSKWVEETTVQRIPRRIMYKVPLGSNYVDSSTVVAPVVDSYVGVVGEGVVVDATTPNPLYPIEYPEAADESSTDEPTKATKRPTLEKTKADDRDARRSDATILTSSSAPQKLKWRSVKSYEVTRKSKDVASADQK